MSGHDLSFFKKTFSILLTLCISTIIFFAINSKLKKLKTSSFKVTATSVNITKDAPAIEDKSVQQKIIEVENSPSQSDSGLHDDSDTEKGSTRDDAIVLKTLMQKFCSFDEANPEFSRKAKTNIVCKIKPNEGGIDVFSFKRLSTGDRKKIYNVIIFSKLEFTKFTEEATEEIRKLNEQVQSKKETEAAERIDSQMELPKEIIQKNTLSDIEVLKEGNEKSAISQIESLDIEQKKLDFIHNRAFFGRFFDLFVRFILFLRSAEIAVLNKF